MWHNVYRLRRCCTVFESDATIWHSVWVRYDNVAQCLPLVTMWHSVSRLCRCGTVFYVRYDNVAQCLTSDVTVWQSIYHLWRCGMGLAFHQFLGNLPARLQECTGYLRQSRPSVRVFRTAVAEDTKGLFWVHYSCQRVLGTNRQKRQSASVVPLCCVS